MAQVTHPTNDPWVPVDRFGTRLAILRQTLGGWNVKRATAHQLRHWFGTECYRACHDLRLVQEMMGHSSPTTTAIYTKLDMSEAAPVVTALTVGTSPEHRRTPPATLARCAHTGE